MGHIFSPGCERCVLKKASNKIGGKYAEIRFQLDQLIVKKAIWFLIFTFYLFSRDPKWNLINGKNWPKMPMKGFWL
jgi:hypothetical protein